MTRKKRMRADLASVQKPAPGKLGIIHAFVNTVDRRMDTEQLSSPVALHVWLAGQGLVDAEAKITEKDLRRALELREALRALVAANSGFALNEKAVKQLDKLAARGRFQVRVGADGSARFRSFSEGFDGALARLFEIVVFAQIDGLWPRLKVCANSACRCAFYDSSKNRSGKWCTSRRCGNQLASHRYRRGARYKWLHSPDDEDDFFPEP